MNENEEKELNEDQLEDIAGGSGGYKCYFVPKRPFEYKEAHGGIAVKCDSACNPVGGRCCCHNSVFCTDRWHVVEQSKPTPDMWFAKPRNDYNHSDGSKIIQPLNIT